MRAAEKAYEYVKSEILGRSFREGEFLTEGAIAETLGISRTPVREAFVMLEAEDLVQLFPKKGALIPTTSPREIKEVMEARSLVEVFATEKVVERRSQIAPKLRALLECQAQIDAQEGDVGDFIKLDRQFHHLMVDNCGNDLLVRFYEGLRDRQIRMGIQAVAYSPQRVAQVLEEHEAIVAAAEEGDAYELKRRVREHLDATLAILKEKAFE